MGSWTFRRYQRCDLTFPSEEATTNRRANRVGREGSSKNGHAEIRQRSQEGQGSPHEEAKHMRQIGGTAQGQQVDKVEKNKLHIQKVQKQGHSSTEIFPVGGTNNSCSLKQFLTLHFLQLKQDREDMQRTWLLIRRENKSGNASLTQTKLQQWLQNMGNSVKTILSLIKVCYRDATHHDTIYGGMDLYNNMIMQGILMPYPT